jgi:hypothetical protein
MTVEHGEMRQGVYSSANIACPTNVLCAVHDYKSGGQLTNKDFHEFNVFCNDTNPPGF